MFSQGDLSQFYGTEHYYRFSPFHPKVVMTDGARFVAKNGGQQGAYWLMDTIASYQPDPLGRCSFQAWTLTVREDKSAVLVCKNGGDVEKVHQEIGYTDFGLPGITLWVEEGALGPHAANRVRVIMLPSEH